MSGTCNPSTQTTKKRVYPWGKWAAKGGTVSGLQCGHPNCSGFLSTKNKVVGQAALCRRCNKSSRIPAAL